MKITILAFTAIAILGSVICNAQAIDKENIPGHYVYSSLIFDSPVDVNNDGIASREFEYEADACALDIHYDLYPDGTGKYTVGMQQKNCKIKQEIAIKWKIKDGKIRQRVKATGKVEEVIKTFLIITDSDGFDPTPYEIVEQSKNKLTLRGEFPDGSDSTTSGNLKLKKNTK